jgi:hypothetical protein
MVIMLKKKRRIIRKNTRFEFSKLMLLQARRHVDWQLVTDY